MGDLNEDPSLLLLDENALLHVSSFLIDARDLISLQLCCKLLYNLLQHSNSWEHVVKLNHGGIQLRFTAAPQQQPAGTSSQAAGPEASGSGAGQAANLLPHYKGLYQLLHQSARYLHPVRFTAVITDGGVDTGRPHYWADNMLNPTDWAPYCSKYSDNVNCFAVLKPSPSAHPCELTHRSLLVGCLQWVLPLLHMHAGAPPQQPEPAQVERAARMLATWKTTRLELAFSQVAEGLAFGDPISAALLRGLPGPPEERRAAAAALGLGIQMRPWYERAYRLRFLPPLFPE
ncbi:hypothetical protein Agub_g4668, partial [Astrephomene gubernaculifera]